MRILLIQLIIFIVVCCQAISATLAPVTDLKEKRLHKRFIFLAQRIREEAARKLKEAADKKAKEDEEKRKREEAAQRMRDGLKRWAAIAAANRQKKG